MGRQLALNLGILMSHIIAVYSIGGVVRYAQQGQFLFHYIGTKRLVSANLVARYLRANITWSFIEMRWIIVR